jgi:hypothetical protein
LSKNLIYKIVFNYVLTAKNVWAKWTNLGVSKGYGLVKEAMTAN